MATKPKLDADLSGKLVDQTDYRSKIRSLMYLISSRRNIVQAVCYCARYQARPTEKHLKEVKRIFRYLRGNINMGLWYPKDSGFEITTFSNVGHAECIDTRKSTSGGIQFLGDKLVSCMLKKQDCTAMSLAEAEYVALSASCWSSQNQRWRWRHLIPAESDSRIKKARELKTKTSANSDIQDLPSRYQVYQGRLLASFQDDAKYEHVGQDTRSQGGKDDKDKQGKDLKISESKTKLKDNDKG
ncbi:hypothetical protein Tco_0793412 [Tanacetum coccineum]